MNLVFLPGNNTFTLRLKFLKILFSLQLTAKVGEALGSAEPLQIFIWNSVISFLIL